MRFDLERMLARGQEDIGPVERINRSGDCQRGMFGVADGVMSVCFSLAALSCNLQGPCSVWRR